MLILSFYKESKERKGFTLVELLTVVAILLIIITISFFGYTLQMKKARDAKRKADLDKAAKIFDEYLDDNNRYPYPPLTGAICDEPLLGYTDKLPCDPLNKEPYIYVYETDDVGSYFRLYAKLENLNDLEIYRTNCYVGRCVEGGIRERANYAVTSPNTSCFECVSGTPPYDPPPPNQYFCCVEGQCVNVKNNPTCEGFGEITKNLGHFDTCKCCASPWCCQPDNCPGCTKYYGSPQ